MFAPASRSFGVSWTSTAPSRSPAFPLLDHGAQPGGPAEAVEGPVHAVERGGLADEAVEGQAAREVEAGEPREIDRGHAAAVVAPEQALATVGKVEGIDGHVDALGGHAQDHGMPTVAEERGQHRQRGGVADGLERVIGALSGYGPDVVCEVRGVAAERVGGAELAGEREAFLGEVDRDYRVGADEPEADQDGLPHAPAPDHDGPVSRPDVGRVYDCPHAGRDG